MARVLAKLVLSAAALMACVDNAQAFFFRRAWRNDCGYAGHSGPGYYAGGMGYRVAQMGPLPGYGGYARGWYPAGSYVINPAPANGTVSAYGDPNSAYGQAKLRVQLPVPDARVWINNDQVRSEGRDRSIDVPVLRDQTQRVVVTAQWTKDGHDVIRKKEVEMRAGQDLSVNFEESEAVVPAEPLPTNPAPLPIKP